MKKIKFLERLILTVLFVGCFTYTQSYAMENFNRTKLKKQQEEYDKKTEGYFKEKRSILYHCNAYEDFKTSAAQRYLFRNNNSFFNSKDGDKYLNEDNEVTKGRDLTEDRELTNEEKKRIIKTIEMLIKDVIESMVYCNENDLKYTYRMYEKFKIRLESYLDAAKRGIINVKIKDLNDFLLDCSNIRSCSELSSTHFNNDGSYLVQIVSGRGLLREYKYNKYGSLLEKHIYVDENIDF